MNPYEDNVGHWFFRAADIVARMIVGLAVWCSKNPPNHLIPALLVLWAIYLLACSVFGSFTKKCGHPCKSKKGGACGHYVRTADTCAAGHSVKWTTTWRNSAFLLGLLAAAWLLIGSIVHLPAWN